MVNLKARTIVFQTFVGGFIDFIVSAANSKPATFDRRKWIRTDGKKKPSLVKLVIYQTETRNIDGLRNIRD
jgi:hypothetical protein